MSESVSKLYTHYEFCERKCHKKYEKHIALQSQAFYVDRIFFRKSLHILKDGASSVQVDILNMCLSKICLKHEKNYINQFQSINFCNDALMLTMKSMNMKKKNPTSKYSKS